MPNSVFVDESLQFPAEGGPAFPCMVKAQILQGGRGKAGGVKKAGSLEEGLAAAKDLMSRPLKGEKLRGVLLEEMLEIDREFYMGITIDDVAGKPIMILSLAGGMDIETVAKQSPEKLVREYLNPSRPLKLYEAVTICKKGGLTGPALGGVARVLVSLYDTFRAMDATLVEINPLIVTKQGDVIAGDSKVIVDDYAAYRHPELPVHTQENAEEDEFEREARENGYILVRLGGDVAVVSGGAGYGMAILDAIKLYGGTPANFLDMPGGNTFPSAVNGVLNMVKKDQKIQSILFSFILSASSLSSIVKIFTAILSKNPVEVPVYGCVNAANAALLEMDMETAKRELAKVGVVLFDDIREAVQAAVKHEGRQRA